MKCKNCSNELTGVEEFAHLADRGREEGLCNKCYREEKEFGGNTIPEGLDTGHKWNIRACSRGCGQLITWDAKFKTDSGISIPLDVKTRQPHNCPKNPYNSSTKTKPIQLSVPKSDLPEIPITNAAEEAPEEVEQIRIPEELLFPLEDIPSDPIIDAIKDGQEERQHAILYYKHEEQDDPPKRKLDELSSTLDPKILQGLKNYGFGNGVLKFQDDSFQAILRKKNTIISAPTGSGKTEAFVVPIIQKICENNYPKGVFALLIYPLRALARDQVTKISKLIRYCKLEDKIDAFTILGSGATSYYDHHREITHKKSVIVATTFDFVNRHLTLVDHKWKDFCQSAEIVAIDELHSYNSFHGSNVYHLIKRMKKRMKDVQYIGSSATLHNAQGFFEKICGLVPLSSVHIESNVGRERDMHKFFIWPLKFPQRIAMEKIAKTCYQKQPNYDDQDKKSRQLIFSNTHNSAEILAANIERSSKMKIDVHRGGLTQDARNLTEEKLKDGEIDGISCTPTLELGIDIGTVDVSISSFKTQYDTFTQRSGRAGREGKKSYAFCVFNPNDASCHYYSRNMLEYITQIHDIEINTDNPLISGKHKEAAKIEEDCINNPMQKSKHFAFQDTMTMRGSAGKVSIYLNGKFRGDRTIPVGYYELHPKAIYHHGKSVYEVESITKISELKVNANLKESDEKGKSTRPIVITRLTKQLEPGVKYGVIELYRIITGYYKGDYNKQKEEWEKHDGSEEKDWVNLDWSSTHMARKIELPSQFIPEDLQGKEDPGIHTIIHVFANAAKIVTKCEAIDIEAHYQDGTIYLYDNTNEGANGVSQMIDEKYDQILETCKKLLDDCDCDKREKPESGGCPKCTFTTGFCSTNNQQLDKKKAREFFGVL